MAVGVIAFTLMFGRSFLVSDERAVLRVNYIFFLFFRFVVCCCVLFRRYAYSNLGRLADEERRVMAEKDAAKKMREKEKRRRKEAHKAFRTACYDFMGGEAGTMGFDKSFL